MLLQPGDGSGWSPDQMRYAASCVKTQSGCKVISCFGLAFGMRLCARILVDQVMDISLGGGAHVV